MAVLEKQQMKFDRKNLSNEELQNIYKALIKPRLIEEKMIFLLRQGKISNWFFNVLSTCAALSLYVPRCRAKSERILMTFVPTRQ